MNVQRVIPIYPLASTPRLKNPGLGSEEFA